MSKKNSEKRRDEMGEKKVERGVSFSGWTNKWSDFVGVLKEKEYTAERG